MTVAPNEADDHEHHPDAWDKHRGRWAPRRHKIHGQSLASWAAAIIANDAERITKALKAGLTAGETNTEIAHRVIGSLDMNGVNGTTEQTRQLVLRLGKGFLQGRKTRMGGTAPDGRSGKTE